MIVKELLDLKQQIDSADKEINQLVYQLYGLTDEKIVVVKMRQFYENWSFLEAPNSSVATDELPESSKTEDKSISAITEFKVSVNLTDFPIDDFLKVSFSHHVQIFTRVKNLDERYFYITKTSQEHLAVEGLNKSIERNDFLHQKELPNNNGAIAKP